MENNKKSQLATDQKAKKYERKTDKTYVSVVADEKICTVLIQTATGIQRYECYSDTNTNS